VSELRSLLSSKDNEEFLFAENRLEKFAELLSIKNTLSSYDYLTNGEWNGIEGRKQFIHVPDLAAEKAGASITLLSSHRQKILKLRQTAGTEAA
jgi:hypothetical protein